MATSSIKFTTMTVTKDNGVIFSMDGKTQYISRRELEGLVRAKCANYERDNIEIEIQELIKSEPNDMSLGSKIRKIYGR